jgi:hypothetical protein
MNEPTDCSPEPGERREGLAIASELIGGISFLTCSFFLVGTLAGLVLGILALRKAKKQPELYGGETAAKTGIAFSILGLLVAVVILPNFLHPQHYARETAALREVQAIGIAQLQYALTKGQGKYTDLRTLGEEGLVDSLIASGQKGGYIFTSNPVEGGDKPMYDTTARPRSTGMWGNGNISFYSNETLIVYDADGGEPPTATAQNRIPANGKPLQ